MSRSFKKVPGFVDGPHPFAKRQANRVARHRPLEDVQNGNWYRKVYDRYNICDWRFMYWSPRFTDDLFRKARRK